MAERPAGGKKKKKKAIKGKSFTGGLNHMKNFSSEHKLAGTHLTD